MSRKTTKSTIVLRGLPTTTSTQEIREEMSIYGGITRIKQVQNRGEFRVLVTYCDRSIVERLLSKGMECDHGNFRPSIYAM